LTAVKECTEESLYVLQLQASSTETC